MFIVVSMQTTQTAHLLTAEDLELAHVVFGDTRMCVDLDGGELGLNVIASVQRDGGLRVEFAAACDGLIWRGASDHEIALAQAWVDAHEEQLHTWWYKSADDWKTESDRSPLVGGVVRSVEVLTQFFARWADAADAELWSRNRAAVRRAS